MLFWIIFHIYRKLMIQKQQLQFWDSNPGLICEQNSEEPKHLIITVPINISSHSSIWINPKVIKTKPWLLSKYLIIPYSTNGRSTQYRLENAPPTSKSISTFTPHLYTFSLSSYILAILSFFVLYFVYFFQLFFASIFHIPFSDRRGAMARYNLKKLKEFIINIIQEFWHYSDIYTHRTCMRVLKGKRDNERVSWREKN